MTSKFRFGIGHFQIFFGEPIVDAGCRCFTFSPPLCHLLGSADCGSYVDDGDGSSSVVSATVYTHAHARNVIAHLRDD